MVDVVNAVSLVQSTTLKQNAQSASAPSSSASAAAAEPAVSSELPYISSSIRVDNLQNVAILEYRSVETGEVVQRYPNQSQIDAFKRAESLTEKSSYQQAGEAPQAAVAATPEVGATSVPVAAPSAPSAETVSTTTSVEV